MNIGLSLAAVPHPRPCRHRHRDLGRRLGQCRAARHLARPPRPFPSAGQRLAPARADPRSPRRSWPRSSGACRSRWRHLSPRSRRCCSRSSRWARSWRLGMVVYFAPRARNRRPAAGPASAAVAPEPLRRRKPVAPPETAHASRISRPPHRHPRPTSRPQGLMKRERADRDAAIGPHRARRRAQDGQPLRQQLSRPRRPSRDHRRRARRRSTATASAWPRSASSAARSISTASSNGPSRTISARTTRSSSPPASMPMAACSRRC